MSNFVLEGTHTEPKVVENLLQSTVMHPRTHELAETGLHAFTLASRASGPGQVAPDAYEAVAGNKILRNAYGDYLETLPPEVQTMLEQSALLYDALPEQVRKAHKKLSETTSSYRRSDRMDMDKVVIQSAVFVSPEDRPKLVAELLFSDDRRIRLNEDVLSIVTTLSKEDRVALLQRVVEHDSADVTTATRAIKMLAEDDEGMASDYAKVLQARLFESDNNGFYARYAFVDLIDLVAADEQEALRKKAATYLEDALVSNDAARISVTMEVCEKVTDDDRRRLEPLVSKFIEKALDSAPDGSAIEFVKYATAGDRAQLLRTAMNGDVNKHRVFLAVHNIDEAPPEARAGLIRYATTQFEGQEGGDPHLFSAFRQIYTVPQEDAAALATEILDNPRLSIVDRLGIAESLDNMPEESRPEIFAKVRTLIGEVLSNPDVDSWKVKYMASLAVSVEPQGDRALEDAFVTALNSVLSGSPSRYEISDTLEAVTLLPEEVQSEYYTKIVRSLRTLFLNNPRKGEEAITCISRMPKRLTTSALRGLNFSGIQIPPTESPLHARAKDGEVVSFKYDGETYIGENENAVRVVPFSAFDAWLRAYTAVDAWKKLGYVPIEPICQVSYADECTTNVAVKTIALRGESMRSTLFYYSTDVVAEILERVDEIRDTIREVVDVEHGHDHEGNFVLVPEKTNGVADPNKMPKVYMIDFDRAVSHEVNKLGVKLGGGGPGA